MNGKLVESREIGGLKYESWKTNCGKSNCKKCPHGPYWYRVIFTQQGKRHVYIGRDLVQGEQRRKTAVSIAKLPDGTPIPTCGRPGRCGCGRVVRETDAAAGFCKSCKSELTLAGLNVPCPRCQGRLRWPRLLSDGCNTCSYFPVPIPFADRSEFYVKESCPEQQNSGGKTNAL